MAISFSLILLMVALTATTHYYSISAAKTRPTSKPSPPPPPPPSELPSPPTTPPPPPPPLVETQQTHLNNIIDALIGAGDFSGWANLISKTDPSALPLTATFFIPGNNAVSSLSSANAAGTSFDAFLIPYHIVPQRLTFSDLLQFTTRARLPTLLHAKYIVVTNNTQANFAVDDSQITQPDIFVNAAFAVHGVKKLLDYSLYGDGRVPSPPSVNATSPKSTPVPPEKRNPFFLGEINLRSGAPCLCSWILITFSIFFCAVFVVLVIFVA
ncbi:hypothetical protein OROGR_000894 [Orobanche gracilis]